MRYKLLKEMHPYSERYWGIIDEDIEFNPPFMENRLDEGRVVTFGGHSKPPEGWCVLLAGGSGSGKGWVINNQLLIDGKIFDVDALKEAYAKIRNRPDGTEWDFTNDEHVAEIHDLIKKKGWKDKLLDMYIDGVSKGVKSNFIIDMTGKDEEDIYDNAMFAKILGYKVALVWVIANRQWAMVMNQLRKRRVKENIFHIIHDSVPITILGILPDPGYMDRIDEAWLVFNGPKVEGDILDPSKEMKPYKQSMGIEHSLRKGEVYRKDRKTGKPVKFEPKDVWYNKDISTESVIPLKRKGNSFIMTPEMKKKILDYLGPMEPSPENPEVYVSGEDVGQRAQNYKSKEAVKLLK